MISFFIYTFAHIIFTYSKMSKYENIYKKADELASSGYTTLKEILSSAGKSTSSEGKEYKALQNRIGRIRKSEPNAIELKGKDFRKGFRYRAGYEHYISKTKDEQRSTKKKKGDMRRLYLISGLSMLFDSDTASEPLIELECIEKHHNLDLVKQLLIKVMAKKVICFRYWQNYETIQEITLHPHLIKEYNNRFFIFGYVQQGTEIVNFSIDRIIPLDDKLKEKRNELKHLHLEEKGEWNDYFYVTNDTFRMAPRGAYKVFFKDIVGVTNYKEHPVETITFRTTNPKVHKLIKTKPIHLSQDEKRCCNQDDDGEGEFTIQVRWNIELRTKLLSFGAGVYVMGDGDFQRDIREQVERMHELYKR